MFTLGKLIIWMYINYVMISSLAECIHIYIYIYIYIMNYPHSYGLVKSWPVRMKVVYTFNEKAMPIIKAIIALLSLCVGNPTVTCEFYSQKEVMCSLCWQPEQVVVWNMHYGRAAKWDINATMAMIWTSICSDADERKHQSSASLAYGREIQRWLVDCPTKGQ